MIQTDVKVVIDGQTHSIRKFGLSDLVALERQFGISSGEMGENLRMEWVAFLVHRRLVRESLIEACAFDDEFMDRIESLEFADDEEVNESVDPTVREALTAS